MRLNFYTGGEEYFICYEDGIHKLKLVGFNHNETICTGSYEYCLDKINSIIEQNLDYDLNL